MDGQKQFVFGKFSCRNYHPYNQDFAEVKAYLKTGIQLYLDDAKRGEEVSTDGSCNLKLSSSFEGVTHKITLKGENSKEERICSLFVINKATMQCRIK